MRPEFIDREKFRAWLKPTELNKIVSLDGVLASSYVARMERLGRPIKSTGKLYRIIDLVARARAECHTIEPAPNGTFERKNLLRDCEALREEIATLEARKAELSQQVARDEAVTELRGSAKALSGSTLLTESEIVRQSNLVDDCCGVYFLIQGERVVYVGQSVNVHSRISGHVDNKEFDGFAYVKCPSSSLDALESLYIHVLRPPLNSKQNGQPCAPIRLDKLLKMAAVKTHGTN